jgi:hypothetical protein
MAIAAVKIQGQNYELLDPQIDMDSLTQAQQATYSLLLSRKGQNVTWKELRVWLNLKSQLPLSSRLKHLEEKGKLRKLCSI